LSKYYFDNTKETSKKLENYLGNNRNSHENRSKNKEEEAILLTFAQIKRHTISVETLDIYQASVLREVRLIKKISLVSHSALKS
jgi:hypothetical protein